MASRRFHHLQVRLVSHLRIHLAADNGLAPDFGRFYQSGLRLGIPFQ